MSDSEEPTEPDTLEVPADLYALECLAVALAITHDIAE